MTGSAFAVPYVLLLPSFSSVITRGRVREGEGHRIVAGGRSADDGKRLSEYLQVRSCAGRFIREKRDDIEKTRGEVWRGEGLVGEAPFSIGG